MRKTCFAICEQQRRRSVRSSAQSVVVWEFYGPVNNEVMSSRSVNSGTVPGQV